MISWSSVEWVLEEIFEGWWLRELWSLWESGEVNLWHWRNLWHLWNWHLVNLVNVERYWGIWDLSKEFFLSWNLWHWRNPILVPFSTKDVLLGVSSELHSVSHLLVFLMEEAFDLMLEIVPRVVLLNSLWVIGKVETHDV